MVTCSFCRQNYEWPKGTTVVSKDGTPHHYCSSKCRKNSEMGRKNKKVKWVRKSKIIKEEKAKKEASYKVRKEAEKEKAEKKLSKKLRRKIKLIN